MLEDVEPSREISIQSSSETYVASDSTTKKSEEVKEPNKQSEKEKNEEDKTKKVAYNTSVSEGEALFIKNSKGNNIGLCVITKNNGKFNYNIFLSNSDYTVEIYIDDIRVAKLTDENSSYQKEDDKPIDIYIKCIDKNPKFLISFREFGEQTMGYMPQLKVTTYGDGTLLNSEEIIDESELEIYLPANYENLEIKITDIRKKILKEDLCIYIESEYGEYGKYETKYGEESFNKGTNTLYKSENQTLTLRKLLGLDKQFIGGVLLEINTDNKFKHENINEEGKDIESKFKYTILSYDDINTLIDNLETVENPIKVCMDEINSLNTYEDQYEISNYISNSSEYVLLVQQIDTDQNYKYMIVITYRDNSSKISVIESSDPDKKLENFTLNRKDNTYLSYLYVSKDGHIRYNIYTKKLTTIQTRKSISREKFVQLLWENEGSPIVTNENSFSDIGNLAYKEAIDWAKDKEIILGVGNNNFNPESPIKVYDIMGILWRLAGKPNVESKEDYLGIPEEDKEDYRQAITWAVQQGIAQQELEERKPEIENGSVVRNDTNDENRKKQENKFNSDRECTEEEAIIFIERYLILKNLQQKDGKTENTDTTKNTDTENTKEIPILELTVKKEYEVQDGTASYNLEVGEISGGSCQKTKLEKNPEKIIIEPAQNEITIEIRKISKSDPNDIIEIILNCKYEAGRGWEISADDIRNVAIDENTVKIFIENN